MVSWFYRAHEFQKINTTNFGMKLRDIIAKHPNAIVKKANDGSKVIKTYVFFRDPLKHFLQSQGLLTETSYMFVD